MFRNKVLVIVLVLVSCFVAYKIVYNTQTNNQVSGVSQVQELPDYTLWERRNGEIPVMLNGQGMNLLAEIYQHTDMEKLQRDTVSVLYDANKNAWITLYAKELGENDGGGVVTKELKQYIFEKKEGKWILVRDFSGNGSDITVMEFFKTNYNLEFVR